MTEPRHNLAISAFFHAGEALADEYFILTSAWPEETPGSVHEDAWDHVVSGIGAAVAQIMCKYGTIEGDLPEGLASVALDGFMARFDRLNEGWMSKGGVA